MRFGTWNVRSLYREGSLMTVVSEISKCKLDLVGVQEMKWDRGGT
jgi:exonuclease III